MPNKRRIILWITDMNQNDVDILRLLGNIPESQTVLDKYNAHICESNHMHFKKSIGNEKLGDCLEALRGVIPPSYNLLFSLKDGGRIWMVDTKAEELLFNEK